MKSLCAYVRNLHETLDYTLRQFEKELTKIRDGDAQRDEKIINLQTGLTGVLSLMNEQYTELNFFVRFFRSFS